MFPRFAILLGLLALTARSGSAQSYTWTGGGANANWSTTGNWSGGNVPASNISNSVVSFNSTSTRRLATTNDLSNLQLNKIVVGSPSGNVSIRRNAISLGAGGIDLSSATRDLTISAPLTVAADQLWAVPAGRTLGIGGILSGANNLTIGGSGGGGTVNLTAANTFAGTVTVNAGTLSVGNALGASARVVVGAGGTFQARGALTIAGLSGAGILENRSTTNRTLTVNWAANGEFSGTIRNGGTGTLGLTKTGSGTLTLSGANEFTGTTTVSGGALVASSSLASNVVVNAAGTFRAGASVGVGLLTGAAGGVVESGTAGGATLTVNAATNGTFAGTIRDGAGPLGLNKAGTGTLTLSGANTYTGPTTVSGGTLVVSNTLPSAVTVLPGAVLRGTGAAAFGPNSSVTVNTAGTFRVQESFTIGSLLGSGTVENRTSVNYLLTVTGGSFGGVIRNGSTGSLGVTKTGVGTLTLSGIHTFTGPLTVNGGTLRVAAGGSLSSSTTAGVSVNSGGTLGGAGTIGRQVGVAAGGTLAPGDAGVGTLTVGNTVTFAANGRLVADLGAGTAADRLTITGTTNGLNFATGADLDLVAAGFSRTAPVTFTLAGLANGANIRIDGTGVANLAVLGTFVQGSGSTGRVDIGVGNLGTPLATGDKFVLSRNANNLVLTFTPAPVPEPATVLGIAAAGLGLAGSRRRRAQSSSGPAARSSSRSSCDRRPSAIRTAPGSITTSPLGL